MSTGERLPHYDAWVIACDLEKRLRPACDQVEVVGSIRRGKLDVGDVELAVLPKFDEPVVDLFGSPQKAGAPASYSALDRVIGELVAAGELVVDPGCQGPRQKRFQIGSGRPHAGFAVELYIASRADAFGNVLLIRTGPLEFSRACLTQWSKGGLMPDHLLHMENRLMYKGFAGKLEPVSCPTEEHFFRAMKIPFVPPRDRTIETVALIRAGRYVG